jgi:hypothetical protein
MITQKQNCKRLRPSIRHAAERQNFCLVHGLAHEQQTLQRGRCAKLALKEPSPPLQHPVPGLFHPAGE